MYICVYIYLYIYEYICVYVCCVCVCSKTQIKHISVSQVYFLEPTKSSTTS